VWAASHTGLGQSVAIKFISREFVTSVEALRRFDAEAKAAAQLRSRHVVQVFDNGALEDGTPYIAMELLKGESVYGRVHRAGPVPLNEALEILAQCCKALSKAHGAGIIHRDIKPDNIFLSSSDEDAVTVKVLDFGIAKFAGGPNDHGSTRTGAVLGTPLYMSPEQARGLKTIDHRTDLYSLGLVAYTMLTGNLAFSSESFGDLLLQICTAPLPSLCANAPWLPASMDAWFQRACAREPQDRFASAQEFSEALKAAGGGAPQAAPNMSASSPGVGSVAAANPAHAVSVGTSSGMSRSGGTSETTAPKGKGALWAGVALLAVGAIAVAAVVGFGKKDHGPATPGTGAAAVTPPDTAKPLVPPPPEGRRPDSTGPVVPSAIHPLPAETSTALSAPSASASSAPIVPAVASGSSHGPEGRRPDSTQPVHAQGNGVGATHTPGTTGSAGQGQPGQAPGQGQGPKPIDLGY
jgi:serine/threonine-protein kinase